MLNFLGKLFRALIIMVLCFVGVLILSICYEKAKVWYEEKFGESIEQTQNRVDKKVDAKFWELTHPDNILSLSDFNLVRQSDNKTLCVVQSYYTKDKQLLYVLKKGEEVLAYHLIENAQPLKVGDIIEEDGIGSGVLQEKY